MRHTERGDCYGSPHLDGLPAYVRPFIVLLLLVGLWLMHGMSGTTAAGCNGAAMPLLMVNADGMADAAAAPGGALTAGASVALGPRAATATSFSIDLSERMPHGELCVSGQPPTSGQDLLRLLTLLALAVYGTAGSRAAGPVGRAVRAARWRAPPGRSGIRLLLTMCVSRT
jgi:hypothetical protein